MFGQSPSSTEPVSIREDKRFKGHKALISSLAFNPSFHQLASADLDGSIMVWSFNSIAKPVKLMGHKVNIQFIDDNHGISLIKDIL